MSSNSAKDLEKMFDVTEEQIASWDEMACEGNLPGIPAGEITRGPGRPKITDEDLVMMSFRITKSQKNELEKKSREKGITVSTYIRDVIDKDLRVS